MWHTTQLFQMFVLCYSLQYGHGQEDNINILLYNSATCLNLFQERNWGSNTICRGFFCDQWFEVRDNGSFVDIVRWTLAEKPVVFGNDITLHCEIPKYMTSCFNNTQWTGGENNSVIAMNGQSSNEAKYKMIQYKRSLDLIIKDFQETDINQRYTCVCGTLVYGNNLTAKEIKFLHIPTKGSIVDFSLIENSMLSVNITLKEVFPAPSCYILFYSDGGNKVPCDTKNVTVATDRISTEYYQAYLTLIFKIPSCTGKIKVCCSVWQESLLINTRKFNNCPEPVNSDQLIETTHKKDYILEFVIVAILLFIVIAAICCAIITKNKIKKEFYNCMYMRVMSN